MSRKQFLSLSAATASGALLAGCGLLSTAPAGKGTGAGSAVKGKESPALASQVKAGSLPPVEQRLPKDPLVVDTIDSIGKYGGTWQTVEASTDPTWLWETVAHDQLIAWNNDWSAIVPNVAKSYDISPDGTTYNFTLREGLRWSDGELFTADDLMFWYENVLLNKQLTPVVPSTLQIAGQPVKVVKHDAAHVSFVFAKTYSLFLQNLAIHGPPFRLQPSHYLKQFHKSFNAKVGKAWATNFLNKADILNNVDLPVITGWRPMNPHGDGGRQVWKRNPYYFKVDKDGSQLPYIDEVDFTFFSDPGPLILRAAGGGVDMYMRAEVTTPKNRPVLADGQKGGHYKLVDVKNPDQNTVGICLNLTHKDPGKRKLYQDKQFRIGLSHAINRQEIINLVFLRQGEPWQTGVRPEVDFYNDPKSMGKQYTEYDLASAQAAFEKAGVGRLDGSGKRLGPDGKPIEITVLTQTRYPFMADALELMTATWAKVGIKLHIDNAASELVSTRLAANDFDCTLDSGELGYKDMLTDPRWLFATGGSSYATLWSNWYEGGEPKEKPPAAMLRQAQLYRDKVVGSADQATQYAAMQQIIDVAKQEFWTMGISLPTGSYAIVSDRMHNVLGDNKMWLAFKCPYPAVTPTSQFYIDPA